MANDINFCAMSGTVTTNPELKVIEKNGKTYHTTTFPIAVHSYQNKETSMFVSIECWNKNAEYAARYFTKGTRIVVIGEYAESNYEKNGHRYKYTKIKAEQFFAPRQVVKDQSTAEEPADPPPMENGFSAEEDESDGAPNFEPQRRGSGRYNMDQIDPDDDVPF